MDQHENLAPQSSSVMQPSEQVRLPAKIPMPTGGVIRALIPQTTDDIWRIAGMAVKSGMCPKGSTPESASISIMHGLEIGLPPMMALQRIAVINGRPCVWGDAVPAIAMNTGQLLEWNEFLRGDGDAMEATCQVSRKTANGICRKESKFSVEDAKKAGLWGKAGPWQSYPKRMLAMRARVAFRDLFADAMCGMYIAEEMIGSIPAIDATSSSFERVERPLADDDELAADTGRTAANRAAGQAQASSAAPNADERPEQPKTVANQQQPQEARGEPAGERQAPDVSTSAPAADAPPGASSEAGGASQAQQPGDIKFPEPWIRRSPSDYVEYAERWMGAAKSVADIDDRWKAERKIRNGLSAKMAGDEMEQLTRLKDAAVDRCRKEQK